MTATRTIPRIHSVLATLTLAIFVCSLAGLAAPDAEAGAWRERSRGSEAGLDPCARLARVQRLFEWIADRHWASARWKRYTRVVNRIIDDRCVALNEIQVVGTHNSYHVIPRPELLTAFVGVDPDALEWEYDHPPLGEQLAENGIRQIELDVFADPLGGLYSQRLALALIGQDPNSGETALDEPGFKVLHVQHADFETTCLTFVACLQAVKAWSDANPRHVPIMILIEAKDEPFFAPPLPLPLEIGADELRALEDEIRSVFPEERIVRPDDVRGYRPSLEEAILEDGWPKLGAVRGKVLFALDNAGKRDALVDGDPSLAGRLIFPNSTPGEPDAAFVKVNDPLFDPTLIPDLVASGYLVRTRADAGLVQGRTGDTTRRDVALASGAQYVSTDFPDPSVVVSLDPAQPFDPDYEVELPDGLTARCNPVNAPASCRSALLE
jgi:hypothetical protein